MVFPQEKSKTFTFEKLMHTLHFHQGRTDYICFSFYLFLCVWSMAFVHPPTNAKVHINIKYLMSVDMCVSAAALLCMQR